MSSHASPDRLGVQVDRLRSHLVQIEESYTVDALEAEEREKELRNRLAVSEEKAAHSSTAVQQARYPYNAVRLSRCTNHESVQHSHCPIISL